MIDATGVDTSTSGRTSVTYDVTDSIGNPAVQVTRTVDVVDTTIPVISLVGANPQTVEVGSPYVELGATAPDNYDGDYLRVDRDRRHGGGHFDVSGSYVGAPTT